MQEDQRTQGQKFEDFSKELGCEDGEAADKKVRRLVREVAKLPRNEKPQKPV
jgi:hypothetical protein